MMSDDTKVPTKVRQSQIVGVSYRPEIAQTTLTRMAAKQSLQLVREPKNPAHANAIAVYHLAIHLGYLPAGLANEIAPLMDLGFKAGARKSVAAPGTGVIDVAWECPDETAKVSAQS